MARGLEAAKLLADIGKISAEIYGILSDKARDRKNEEKDARIRELEAQVADLRRKLEALEKGK